MKEVPYCELPVLGATI